MTRRTLTHALAGLNTLAVFALARCAVVLYEQHQPGYAIVCLAGAVLLLAAVGAHCYLADELRAAEVRYEHASRPRNRHPAIEDAVAIELAAACCETWWTSFGAEHDTGCRHAQEERA